MNKIMKQFIVICCFLIYSTISLAQKNTSLPYKEAKRYFLKNNIDPHSIHNPKIDTKEEFERLFGQATVMGKDGTPTKIDFSKEYVIAVVENETDKDINLVPKSLKKAKKGDLIFEFQLKEGQAKGFNSVPSLLIVVDRKHKGNVVLKKITK